MTYRGAVLDVDGTVVRGDEPILGAAAGVEALAATGVRRLYVSNNPTKPPGAYKPRLAAVDPNVEARDVLTSGTVTARYLAEERPEADLFVLGELGFVDQLTAAGLSVVDADEDADAVVASLDRSFDYDSLCEAFWTLSDESVAFYGTDPDRVIPAAGRNIPGSGAVINAIAGVAGRDPDMVFGKPSEVMRRTALEALNLPPEDCLVVGDRLNTDVVLGAAAGMTTVLVRTGVTDDRTLAASDVEPDFVLDSLAGIERVLDAPGE